MSEPEQPEEYFLKGGGGFEGTKEAAKFSFAGMCDMAASYAEYRVADAESRMENRMKAVPTAAETAMTAEQKIDELAEKYSDLTRDTPHHPAQPRIAIRGACLEMAAHVREAAQGEIDVDLDELRNHIAEQNTQLARIAAALKIDFISAKYVAETVERRLAEAQRLHDEYRVKDQQYLFHLEGALETKTAKLAELEKALRDLINEFQLHLPNIKERDSLALSAALASLRAESKEG